LERVKVALVVVLEWVMVVVWEWAVVWVEEAVVDEAVIEGVKTGDD
jgi:hypothetical protein